MAGCLWSPYQCILYQSLEVRSYHVDFGSRAGCCAGYARKMQLWVFRLESSSSTMDDGVCSQTTGLLSLRSGT